MNSFSSSSSFFFSPILHRISVLGNARCRTRNTCKLNTRWQSRREQKIIKTKKKSRPTNPESWISIIFRETEHDRCRLSPDGLLHLYTHTHTWIHKCIQIYVYCRGIPFARAGLSVRSHLLPLSSRVFQLLINLSLTRTTELSLRRAPARAPRTIGRSN